MRDAEEIQSVIDDTLSLMPERLIISERKWRFLTWCVLRGENVLFTGPSGFGKTLSAVSVADVMDRPMFDFNMGATQDPRTAILGTKEAVDGSTVFVRSRFIDAVRTENAVIVMDEISRADPEAWNILMPVLDPGSPAGDSKSRHLRLDASQDRERIEVADGVTFIATANTGVDYTSARRMDRALMDRFSVLEVDIPTVDQETELVTLMFPTLDESAVETMCTAVQDTREMHVSRGGRLSELVSTRAVVECAKMLRDGFSVRDALRFRVYPIFDDHGGDDSDRTLVRDAAESIIPAAVMDRRVNDGDTPDDESVPFGAKYFS